MITAIDAASRSAGGSEEYRKGYTDALKSLAMAFGCMPEQRYPRVQKLVSETLDNYQ